MSTLAARLEGDGQARAWIREHLDYPHDWCLIWPFSRIQSGYATFGSEHIAVHRFMCEHRNGPQPADKPHAAHSCGRGHEGCVNPRHLDWKTISENQLDRYIHSGPQPRWKLTPQQVDEIRALKDRARVIDIARQFGISDTNVRNIHAGRLWKQDRTDYRQWTTEEIHRIRTSPVGVVGTVKALAEEFGVTSGTIYRIKNGQSYGHVQDEVLAITSPESKS
jgi:hypothetical protein